METTGLNVSRWLDAIWEPNAQICTLPDGLNTLDVVGDGDVKLIAADLTSLENPKLRVFKAGDQTGEYPVAEIPSAVSGFYTDNIDRKSSVLAVGAGSSVFMFKNMKPHFKFCLPQLTAHQKEQDIWYKAGLDEELNVSTLADDLDLLLGDIGAAHVSPRTLKFLSLEPEIRRNFAEQYRRQPLVKLNVVTTLGAIRKDSWGEVVCHYLIVGTELGDVLIVDPRAYFVTDKQSIGWAPVTMATVGLWSGDGQIVLVSRDGRLGVMRRGSRFMPWEALSAPVVAIATMMSEGVAVATMNGSLFCFSKAGVKLWKIQLPGNPLDMVSVPVPQSGLSLLAISIAGSGIRIYDQKHLVDTINTMDSISVIKYGRLGHEERAMTLVTCSGGLAIKILKRTAEFGTRSCLTSSSSMSQFPDNLIQPPSAQSILQHSMSLPTGMTPITPADLTNPVYPEAARQAAKDVFECQPSSERSSNRNIDSSSLPVVSMQCSVLGLGPSYILRLVLTCGQGSPLISKPGLYILVRDDGSLREAKPRIVKVPPMLPGLALPMSFTLLPAERIACKLRLLLCRTGSSRPVASTWVSLPLPEDDIEV
ncbi:hypothetical protein QAD02_019477 [Eretmocerus hayati]|uniref:Uncharacterized protein n=1 Tax=Eretmocerus hayati TaxID=131215 RepID=A0ACC2PPH7_9HYME|nr:hypothetical protein QAD02_019477 [Eretmocerus hayati]